MELLPEQRWLLALSAVLTERNNLDHKLLGGSRRPIGARKAVYALAHWWGVYTPSDVQRILSWLFDEGHRGDYASETKRSAQSMLGWDLGRCASVAGWAYGAYLLERDVAWEWLRKVATIAQSAFDSFEELYASYLRGLEVWAGDGSEQLSNGIAAVEALRALADSPIHLPWKLDAANAPPIDEHLNVVEIAEGASISEAVQRAGDGGRVVLAPGAYCESVRVPFALELRVAGDGEATIEAPGGQHALHVRVPRSVFARGLRLRSTPGADGKTCNAVHVGQAFMRLERCDVQGGYHGVGLVAGGDLHVFDTHVHDCAKSGLHVEDGCAVVVDTRLSDLGLHGVWRAKGTYSAILENVEIANAGGAGAWVGGEAILRNVQVRGAKTCALLVEGGTEAENCRLDGGAAVVNVNASGRLSMKGSTLRGGASAGLQVQGGWAQLDDAIIEANTNFGVVAVGTGASVMLRDVVLRGHDTASVYCVDGAVVHGDRCELVGGRVGAWARGGRVYMARTTISETLSSGVQAAGGEMSTFVDCIIRDSRASGAATEPDAAGLRLSRCTIEHCAGAGIDLSPRSRLILEDCTSDAHGAPDVIADAKIERVDGGMMDARSLVVEHDGDLTVELTHNPALAYFLDARGSEVPAKRTALALFLACEAAVGEANACGFRVESDAHLVVRARDAATLAKARQALVSALGDGRQLRALVDAAERAELFPRASEDARP